MSVLVKGMKMPENCEECFFVGLGYPDYCSLPQIPNGEDEIEDISVRPDWCPLVEVPEKHGRLIDADALTELWYGCKIVGSITPLINARPTVIEAEDNG